MSKVSDSCQRSITCDVTTFDLATYNICHLLTINIIILSSFYISNIFIKHLIYAADINEVQGTTIVVKKKKKKDLKSEFTKKKLYFLKIATQIRNNICSRYSVLNHFVTSLGQMLISFSLILTIDIMD